MTTAQPLVRDVMWPHVFRVRGGDSILLAGLRMREFNVGSALVFEDRKLVGVITERDLLRAFVAGADTNGAIVRDYMTPRPVTVDVDASFEEAASLLITVAARHLPVTKGAEVVGVLSARDLLPLIAGTRRPKARLYAGGRYDGPEPTLASAADVGA